MKQEQQNISEPKANVRRPFEISHDDNNFMQQAKRKETTIKHLEEEVNKNKTQLLIWSVVMAMMMLTFVSTASFAQIKTEEVDIVKPYQPLLADAVKIDVDAQPATMDTLMSPLKYEVKQHLIEVPFTPSEIRPLAMPKEDAVPLLNNMVKAGFGTQWSPLAEVFLSNGRSDKFNYGLQFHHLSSNGKLADQNFSENNAAVFGTNYFKGSSLTAKIFYDRNVFQFYGYDHSDTSLHMNEENLKQHFSTIGAALGFMNTKRNDAGWNYRFDLDFYNWNKSPKDTFLQSYTENHFGARTLIQKKIADLHSANLLIGYQHQQLSDTSDASASFVSIIPYYQFKNKVATITAGLNCGLLNTTFQLFPHFEAEYKLVGDFAVPYAGWKGQWQPNLLRDIAVVNPFIGNVSLAAQKYSEVYGGLKGSYGNNISYNVRLGYQSIDNDPFYLPDTATLSPTIYSLVYYYSAHVVNFHAEIGYRDAEHINVILSGDLNSFDLDFNDKPWGIPEKKLGLSINYNVQKKIILTSDVFAYSGTYTILPGAEMQSQLKGTLDLNLSATYNYKKNFSLFLMLNNLASSKYQRYYNYPSYGLQALAGLSVKF